MKVQAAVVNEANKPYVLEELNLADLQDDEIRVKIVATGVCHSDDALRLGHWPYPLPAVFGHEGSGIVEGTGKSVKHVKVGDHVVLAYAYCSHCQGCLEGAPVSCESWLALNWGSVRADGSRYLTRNDGSAINNFYHQSSFATHANVKEQNAVVVSKDEDLRILGPLSCGQMTGFGTVVKALAVKPGTSIAVFGAGAVGLAAIMAAKIAGATTIVAVDILDSRLELAKELGATHAVNTKSEDPQETIRKISGGKGVNYSIDTTGVSAVMKTSIDVLAVRGVAAPIAITNKELTISTTGDLASVGRSLIGVLMGATVPQISIPELIAYYKAGKFPYDRLIKTYDFADINQASADSLSGRTIKPVLIVDKSYRP